MQNEAPIGAATALSLSGGFLIFIRGKGFMKKLLVSTLVACGLSACSYDNGSAGRAPDNTRRAMPDIFQPMTPTQQRAVMSGERPDWTETPPVRIPRR